MDLFSPELFCPLHPGLDRIGDDNGIVRQARDNATVGHQIGTDLRGEIKEREGFFTECLVPWIDMDNERLVTQYMGRLFEEVFKNRRVLRVGTQSFKPDFCLGKRPFKRGLPGFYQKFL